MEDYKYVVVEYKVGNSCPVAVFETEELAQRYADAMEGLPDSTRQYDVWEVETPNEEEVERLEAKGVSDEEYEAERLAQLNESRIRDY